MNLTFAADVICKGKHVESMFANDVQVWPPDYNYYQIDFEFDPAATYTIALRGMGFNQTSVGYMHANDITDAEYRDVNNDWHSLDAQEIANSVSEQTNDFTATCNWLYYTMKGTSWFNNFNCFTFKTGASMSNAPIRVSFWGFLDNDLNNAVKLASKVFTCSPNTVYTLYRGEFN